MVQGTKRYKPRLVRLLAKCFKSCLVECWRRYVNLASVADAADAFSALTPPLQGVSGARLNQRTGKCSNKEGRLQAALLPW